MEDLRWQLTAIDRTRGAFDSVRRNIGLADRSAMLLSSRFKGIGVGLLGGLAGGAIMSALTNPLAEAKEAFEEFSAIGEKAQSTGLSTDFYQALGGAALDLGVDQEKLNSALLQFVARVGEAKAGQGELVSGYKKLNPELLEAIRHSEDQEAALKLVADAVDSATSADEKARIGKVAFGKAWGDVNRIMNDGAKGLDGWVARARAMGLVIDKDLIARADELGDEFDVASKVIDLQLKSALVELSPVIVDVTKGIASLVKEAKGSVNSGLAEEIRLWLGALNDVNNFDFSAAMQKLKTASDIRALGTDQFTIDKYDASRAQFGKTPAYALPNAEGPAPKPLEADVRAQEAAQKRINDTIAALELEQAQLTMTNREQAVSNALKQAGITAESQYAASVQAAAEKLFDAKQHLDAINQAQQLFAETAFSAFDRLILQGEDLNEVLADVAQQLLRAALLAALLGQGPLAGLMGTKPAGDSAVGGLAGALFGGFRASGGSVSAGKGYVVGEHGAEFFIPGRSGTIMPDGGPSNDNAVTVNVYAPPGSSVRQERRSSGSGQQIDVFIEQIESAMGQRVVEGRSKLGSAIASTHGLRRIGR